MKHTTPHPLRIERLRKGWTQQQLADFAQVSVTTIERAERGEILRIDSCKRLCECLGKERPEELGLQCYGTDKKGSVDTERSDDVNRRKALQIFGVAGVALAKADRLVWNAPLWERLSRALARTSSVDEEALQSLELMTKNYWHLRKTLGYRALLSSYIGQLETIHELLRHSQPSSIHRRLCAMASEVAQYIGASLFDMNEYPTARSYYSVAIEAAEEAENDTLIAIGLGRMSSLPIYEGNAHDALPFLGRAQQIALHQSTTTISAWLVSLEAEAYAHLRDSRACHVALSRAERLSARIQPHDTRYTVQFDYPRFLGYKGACHLSLKEPKAAIETLNEAIQLIDPLSLRQRSIVLADSAYAHGQLKKVDEACKLAGQALAMTAKIPSNIAIQRIQTFRAQMRPWEGMDDVKKLDDQITTYTLATS